MKIRLTSVLVDDQEKALQFYTGVLGFVKKRDIPMGGPRWLTSSRRKGRRTWNCCSNETGIRRRSRLSRRFSRTEALTAFAVDDIEKEYERLHARGVAFKQKPTPAGPVTLAVFDDTCGNLIQIYQTVAVESATSLSTTSRAALSVRTPSSRGWRSLPCPVHSMKATWTTISGRTQCARRRGSPTALVNGVLRDLERVEPRAQLEQQLRVEAGADLAGEDEVVAVVVADEQRAEADARALRIGEAADDELLRRLALHLQPVRRAAMLVRSSRGAWRSRLPSLRGTRAPRASDRRARHARERRLSGKLLSSARRSSSGSDGDVAARRARGCRTRGSRVWPARPTAGGFAVEDRRRAPAGCAIASTTAGYARSAAAGCARTAGRPLPFLNASSRMPSSLRSKIHSGPVNRSCVSVAAIGSSHSGKLNRHTLAERRLNAETAETAEMNARQRPASPAAYETERSVQTQNMGRNAICVCAERLVS